MRILLEVELLHPKHKHTNFQHFTLDLPFIPRVGERIYLIEILTHEEYQELEDNGSTMQDSDLEIKEVIYGKDEEGLYVLLLVQY